VSGVVVDTSEDIVVVELLFVIELGNVEVVVVEMG
jgi:hypothetical protein